MTEEMKPNLSVPEAEGLAPRRAGRRGPGILTVILLVAILVLQILLLRRPAGTADRQEPPATQNWRSLAVRAEQRNLHRASATALRRHLAELTEPEERGKILYKLAVQLMHAGDYEEAIASFWQAEESLGAESELATQITDRVAECFERLGKHAEKDREVRERVTVGAEPGTAGKIAAEIGYEKIPLHEVDRRIKREVELQLRWLVALPPDKEAEVRKQLLDRYANPQEKLNKLYDMIGQELLCRRGMELKIDQEPELRELLGQTRTQILANAVLARELRDRIKPTDSDLRTYFTAFPEKFQIPPRATVRLLPVQSQEAADELIAQVTTEEDLIKAATKDEKDHSVLAENLGPKDPIPGIGPLPPLSQAVFSRSEPGMCEKAVAVGGAFFVFYVRSLEPSRTPDYDSVKGQVLSEYVKEKQQELRLALIQELFAQFDTIIHDDVVLGRTVQKEQPKEEKKSEAAGKPEKEKATQQQ